MNRWRGSAAGRGATLGEMPDKGDVSKRWRKLLLCAAVAVDLFPLKMQLSFQAKRKDRELSNPYAPEVHNCLLSLPSCIAIVVDVLEALQQWATVPICCNGVCCAQGEYQARRLQGQDHCTRLF
jgi:hypothetical protein